MILCAKNFTGNGIYGIGFISDFNECFNCFATNGASSAQGAFVWQINGAGICAFCVAYGNATVGFNTSTSTQGTICLFCVAANNTGATSDGFQLAINQGNVQLLNSVAYNNGRDGLRITNNGFGTFVMLNDVFYGNGGYGLNYTNGALPVIIQQLSNYNGFGGNTTAARNNIAAGSNDVTLTADPFVAGASNNFALNNTAGGGAALRGAGYPGILSVGGTGFLDIGVLQHKGGGGGQVAFPILQ